MSFSATALFFALAAAPFLASSQSIADVASETDSLSQLVSFVVTADLLSAIDGSAEGNITVFAPTNDAFDELAPSFAANLMEPAWRAHLSSILQTHIVDSVIPSSAITAPTAVSTLSGERVDVTIDPITVGGAEVTAADIAADNGVVHVIDSVITPGWVDTTIPAAASSVDSVSTLVTLLGQADLVDALNGEGPFTVFAPTNEAFSALGEDVTACVTENAEFLRQTLLYHVLGDSALVPASLVQTGSFATLQSTNLDIDAATLKINKAATITGPDALLANNGIVHIIDTVLVPPSIAANITTCANGKKTIPELASGVADVSTLVSLLSKADLVDTLNGDGPFTVFAPTNAAFDALGEPTTACVTGNSEWLKATLLYHVLPGLVPAAEVKTGEFETVQGTNVNIDATALTVNTAKIAGPDALVGVNGVAHVIDAVLVPPAIVDDITACVEAANADDGKDKAVDTAEGDDDSSAPASFFSVALSSLLFVVAFLAN